MATPGQVIGVGKLVTPGGKQGPKGDAGTAVPLADITQNGLLRQISGLTTDFVDGTNNCQQLAPQIWSVRLRSYNSTGNPSFMVDQANVGAGVTNLGNGARIVDRWFWGKSGTHTVNSSQPGEFVNTPGTNYLICDRPLKLTVGTAQATLAAGDYGYTFQTTEGPQLRP